MDLLLELVRLADLRADVAGVYAADIRRHLAEHAGRPPRSYRAIYDTWGPEDAENRSYSLWASRPRRLPATSGAQNGRRPAAHRSAPLRPPSPTGSSACTCTSRRLAGPVLPEYLGSPWVILYAVASALEGHVLRAEGHKGLGGLLVEATPGPSDDQRPGRQALLRPESDAPRRTECPEAADARKQLLVRHVRWLHPHPSREPPREVTRRHGRVVGDREHGRHRRDVLLNGQLSARQVEARWLQECQRPNHGGLELGGQHRCVRAVRMGNDVPSSAGTEPSEKTLSVPSGIVGDTFARQEQPARLSDRRLVWPGVDAFPPRSVNKHDIHSRHGAAPPAPGSEPQRVAGAGRWFHLTEIVKGGPR